MKNKLDLAKDTGRPRVNIADIPDDIRDSIFELMEEDKELVEQLNKIESNPSFSEEKKLLFSKYRIQVAFEKYYFETLDNNN